MIRWIKRKFFPTEKDIMQQTAQLKKEKDTLMRYKDLLADREKAKDDLRTVREDIKAL